MPKYLAKLKFTPEGLKNLRQSGAVNLRETAYQDFPASVGGTAECYYFAFGEYDLYGILDLPDDEAAAALSLAGNAGGLIVASTTKLLTAEQIDEAFKRTVDYRPPGT